MKGMILAAGRGERLRPLTDKTPKPLLMVKGGALLVHQIKKLRAAGINEIIINVSWLADKIIDYLGSGKKYNIKITYSKEPPGALETAGGIIQALKHLGSEPFIVVNSDIWCDFDFKNLDLPEKSLAQLVMVKNPKHNPLGDFAFIENSRLGFSDETEKSFTFSGIGIYRPELFQPYKPGRRVLIEVLGKAIEANKLTGVLHNGYWFDIGTRERLKFVDSF